MSIRVRNWRDQAPYVGHISALVWTLYQSHDKDETSPPEINRLHGINSFVKHGLRAISTRTITGTTTSSSCISSSAGAASC